MHQATTLTYSFPTPHNPTSYLLHNITGDSFHLINYILISYITSGQGFITYPDQFSYLTILLLGFSSIFILSTRRRFQSLGRYFCAVTGLLSPFPHCPSGKIPKLHRHLVIIFTHPSFFYGILSPQTSTTSY